MGSSSTTQLSAAMLLFALIFFSCTKDSYRLNPEIRELSVYFDETLIKINQAIVLVDRTDLKDSIDFVTPPTDKRYDWIIAPNNGCADVKGGNNPFGSIIFKCPGTYRVSANVYDSLTNRLIAHTSTVEVRVMADTLHPSQPIPPDDGLNIRPSIVKAYSDPYDPSTSIPDEVYVSLYLTTTKTYEYSFNKVEYTSSVGINNYAYVFSDSVKLETYPLAFGYGQKGNIWIPLHLKGLRIGVPATVRITWLGRTYAGTITLINNDRYTFEWDNSGAVKVI